MNSPISMEVLRFRLEAICEEAGLAIERTAISTVVVESKDYGVMITDASGGLIVGAGATQTHFYAAQNAVNATLERHGDDIAQGNIYLSNDPHNGGGLHPQDVFILAPVFVDDKLTAWVATTAHMMDMGGMVPGSFAPAATECYQEAIRFPPVLLMQNGREVKDIWSVFFNNIRFANLVELDLRGLIAGCHVAHEQLEKIVQQQGRGVFLESVRELNDRTEKEFRRRIEAIEDGEYSAVGFNEWNNETFQVPCRLTVKGDKLLFDFEGASPQAPHFFNSKPFIIVSELAVEIAAMLGQDLPYNRGLFDTFEVKCPEGSIVNCEPPAPIGFGHVEVSFNAVETAMRALMLAISASPDSTARQYLTGPTAGSSSALHTWAGQGLSGAPDGWLMMDGGATGASGSHDRDGEDLFGWMVSSGGSIELPDIEVTESWYPIEFLHRQRRQGIDGAGQYRGGAGLEVAYRLSGSPMLFGTVFANRRRIPLPGLAGGYPGALTRITVEGAQGERREIEDHAQNYELKPEERFVVQVASGGGYGDPVDRAPSAVEADLKAGRLSDEEAREVYGAVAGNKQATEDLRKQILTGRLAAALPAPRPIDVEVPSGIAASPLYPGIEQIGNLAVSTRTGAVLAQSPDHWTDGCPRIRNFLPAGDGVEIVGYIDPKSGHLFAVDVVAQGFDQSFKASPQRWTEAAGAAQLSAAE